MTRATHKQHYLPFTGFRKWKIAGYPVRRFPRKEFHNMTKPKNDPEDTIIVPPDFWYGLIVVLLTIVVFGTILIVLVGISH